MTEAEWVAATDPGPMLDFLRGKVSDRKLRLFAVACCRRVERLAPGPEHRATIEVVERFVDGKATALEVEQSCRRCGHPDLASSEYPWVLAGEEDAFEAAEQAASEAAVQVGEFACARSFSIWRSKRFRTQKEATSTERTLQVRVLHDVTGNPFRPAPVIAPAWLAWQGGVVRELARAAYEERRMPEGTLQPERLAELADALEGAGCRDAELLGHLRGPGVHVRGCYAVDLLLGKA